MTRTLFAALAIIVAVASTAGASRPVEFRHGLLFVNGRPFYPLGTWGTNSPEELLELGMNVDFHGAGGPPEALRDHVNLYARHGLLSIPYMSSPPKLLADSPKVLAWYLGDDITEPMLPGLLAAADAVHANDHMHPTVADFWDEARIHPQDRAKFRRGLDIMCQYTYPIPDGVLGILPGGKVGLLNGGLEDYFRFFDRQRLNYGDPLWTWIQAFTLEGYRPLRAGAGRPSKVLN